MKNFDDDKIIEGIKRGDKTVLEYVYAKYYPLIRWNLVTRNNLSKEEAKDIFQDTLIALYKEIKQDDFILKFTFKTFLYSICKNYVIKKINLEMRMDRKFEFDETNKIFNEMVNTDEYKPDNKFIAEVKKNLIRKYFMQLSEDCQKILRLYVENVPYEKILTIMGYSDVFYTRKRRHDCKDKLKIKIEKDILYNKIKKIIKDE